MRASQEAALWRLCLPAQEVKVHSLGWEGSLEKGMTPHSSILAWRIPWTEEPGRLWSMRSQRVRCDWATGEWKIQKGFFTSSLNFTWENCALLLWVKYLQTDGWLDTFLYFPVHFPVLDCDHKVLWPLGGCLVATRSLFTDGARNSFYEQPPSTCWFISLKFFLIIQTCLHQLSKKKKVFKEKKVNTSTWIRLLFSW